MRDMPLVDFSKLDINWNMLRVAATLLPRGQAAIFQERITDIVRGDAVLWNQKWQDCQSLRLQALSMEFAAEIVSKMRDDDPQRTLVPKRMSAMFGAAFNLECDWRAKRAEKERRKALERHR